LDVTGIQKGPALAGPFLITGDGLVNRVDNEITTDQHHRDANEQRNKKNGHETLLSVVALGARQRAVGV
jgi:hypothetical protein